MKDLTRNRGVFCYPKKMKFGMSSSPGSILFRTDNRCWAKVRVTILYRTCETILGMGQQVDHRKNKFKKFTRKSFVYSNSFRTFVKQNTTTMEYKIIEGGSPNEITRKVNDLIKEGWTPVGSHQVVVRREQNRFSGQQHMDTLNTLEYTQTLTREEKNKCVIEVDVMFNHPEDEDGNVDESVKEWDIEGMREEFESKLHELTDGESDDDCIKYYFGPNNKGIIK